MSVHKKFQPNRSSRLAGYRQHIYTNVLLYYINNFYKIKWYEEYNNFKYSSLSQSACPQFLFFLPPFACPFPALLLKECLPVSVFQYHLLIIIFTLFRQISFQSSPLHMKEFLQVRLFIIFLFFFSNLYIIPFFSHWKVFYIK